MEALAQHSDEASLKVLGDLAQHAKSLQTREQAISALGSAADPRSTSILLSASRDSDPRIKREALVALQRIGGPDAERAIVDATTSSDMGVRMYAVSSLGRLGTPASESQLERLASDKDQNVARVALTTLAQHAPARATGFVDRALRSDDPRTRTQALEIASSLDAATARRVALTAIKDPDESVVSAAVSRLAEMGGPEAQNALIDVLSNARSSDDVKREAADALQEMGGEAARRWSGLIDKYKTPEDDGEESRQVPHLRVGRTMSNVVDSMDAIDE
jgi:HEAT repeat protein